MDRLRNLYIIGSNRLISGLINSAIRTYLAIFLSEIGVSAVLIGIAFSVGAIITAIARILGGYIADTHGRKLIIVILTYVLAIITLIPYLYPPYRGILLRFILSSIVGIYQPALFALFQDSFPEEGRGKTYGYFNVATMRGWLFGPLLAAIVVKRYGVFQGVRLLFLASAIVYLGVAISRHFLIETFKSHKKNGFLQGYIDALGFVYHKVPNLILASLIFSLSFGLLGPVIPLYVVYHKGIPKPTRGLIARISGLSGVSSALRGRLIDRSRTRWFRLGLSLIILGLILLILAPSYSMISIIWIASARFISGLGGSAANLTLSVVTIDLVPTELRGRYNAISGFLNGTFNGIANSLSGVEYNYNPNLPLINAAILYLLVYPIFPPRSLTASEAFSEAS